MIFSRAFLLSIGSALVLVPTILIGLYYQDTIIETFKDTLSNFRASNTQKTHTITLTENGFEPRELHIATGETIIFTTTLDGAFWPASNIHPEHSLYPAFDPLKPIASGDSWEYTFTEDGVYPFHDHIFANYTGYIYVGNTKQTISPEDLGLDITSCAQITQYNQKRACWDKQLERAMEVGGAEGAFAYFSQLYKTEPDVPKECHGWSHTLGKAGYQFYKIHGTINLQSETSACGYGFYHAFLGELMKDTGDVQDARAFCERTTASLPEIETSCKHGIGHGASSIFSENPEYYGKFEATANEAIAICERVYTLKADLTECYDGVFNEIYVNTFNSAYGYVYSEYRNAGKPFWQCQLQDKKYKESCYINVVGMFWEMFNRDVVAAMKYALTDLQDLEHTGPRIVAKISADRIQESIVASTHKDSIEACALVPDYLFDACFNGILNGFLQHGDPNNLHTKGVSFCKELADGYPRQSNCANDFMSMVASRYSRERLTEVCSSDSLIQNTEVCTQLLSRDSATTQ